MKKSTIENRAVMYNEPLYVKPGDGTMTVGELLEILKDERFAHSAHITIDTNNENTNNDHNGYLTVAYMCPSGSGCGKLHLISTRSWVDEPMFSPRVLINKAGCEDTVGITKIELEKVLRSVGKNVELTITTEFDPNETHYPLTSVLKCKECNSIHFYSSEISESEK